MPRGWRSRAVCSAKDLTWRALGEILPEYAWWVSRRTVLVVALLTCVLAAFLGHVVFAGTYPLGIDRIVHALSLGPGAESPEGIVVWRLRLPRAIGALLAGGSLAAIGAVFQALFRNPLAEPYVVGVSSGAAATGTAGLLLGLTGLGVPLASMVGALGVVGLVVLAGRKGTSLSSPQVMVGGVVLGSMLAGVTSILVLGSGGDTNSVLRWLLGSFGGMDWQKAGLVLVVSGGACLWIYRYARVLNPWQASAELPGLLGIDTGRVERHVLVASALAVGVLVGSVGIIGFVGLVAPHLARLVVGPNLVRLVPSAACAGALLMLASDIASVRAVGGMELPIGAVTALLGAPALLWIMGKPARSM